MRARLRQTVIATTSLAALVACHRGGRSQALGPPGAPAIVIFANDGLDQAEVFAIPRGGSRLRIGTVMGGRTDTLQVPTIAGAGNVTIIARLLARSNTPSTGPLSLSAGDRIIVRLPIDGRLLSVLPAP